MRPYKESIVTGEDVEHFIGTLGCTQLVSKPCSNGCLHFINSVVITIKEMASTNGLIKTAGTTLILN